MRTITAKDGARIFYKDWGKGQPIVFSHGWPLSLDAWDNQMLFFGQHGYRLLPMTAAVVAEMLKQGSGHIVQITTSLIDHANSSVPSVLASLTKGGLSAATKSLAIEYAKKGIRVNAVAPGVIKTPMHAPETHEFLAGLHPVGHMGEVQDIGDAILFLENAAFITGETIHVDGGQSAGH
jgi:NAD(P)-dependent dehydrogenase (short-subunit alcohol dehydrogenase family)